MGLKNIVRNWLGIKDHNMLSKDEIIDIAVQYSISSEDKLRSTVYNIIIELSKPVDTDRAFESHYHSRLQHARGAFALALIRAVAETSKDTMQKEAAYICENISSIVTDVRTNLNSEKFLDEIISRIKNKQIN